MNLKRVAIFSVFIISLMLVTLIAFAQEPVASPEDSAVVSIEPQAMPKNSNDTQWAWGEVINLDAQAKTITLKYLDYETDQEKDIVLAVDENTAFENINSFDELKIKDTLSIDYTLGSDGKNIAKNVNFEKPDALADSVTAVSAPEVTPVAETATSEVEAPAPANEAPVTPSRSSSVTY